MITAYKEFWRRYADFEGRSTRSEYWYAFLANILIEIILLIISIMILATTLVAQGYDASSVYDNFEEIFITIIFSFILFFGYILATLVPNIAIAVRRLRDAGYHWGFVFLDYGPTLLGFIPSFSVITNVIEFPCYVALIILLCQPTKYDVSQVNNGYNNQGAQPYGQPQHFGTNSQNFNPGANQPFGQPQNPQPFGQSSQNFNQGQAAEPVASQPFP